MIIDEIAVATRLWKKYFKKEKWFHPVIKLTKLKKNEYKCSMCGNVYKKGWSEEEALAEKNELWGSDITIENCVMVCDDCFKKIL